MVDTAKSTQGIHVEDEGGKRCIEEKKKWGNVRESPEEELYLIDVEPPEELESPDDWEYIFKEDPLTRAWIKLQVPGEEAEKHWNSQTHPKPSYWGKRKR